MREFLGAPDRRRHLRVLFGTSAVLIAAGVWGARILRTYFTGDDFLHLYQLQNVGFREMILAPFGGHMLIASKAIMASTFHVFGFESLPFFAGVLLTHLVNTALVFVLGYRVSEDMLLAFLAAVLFAVSPMHGETLAWYSVYGHVLACFCTLLMLVVLVPRPGDRSPLTRAQAVFVAAVMAIASQCFGAGTAVALATPLVAILLRPATLRRPMAMAILLAVPVCVVLTARILFFRASPLTANPGLDAAVFMAFARDLHFVLPMLGHLMALGLVSLLLGSAYPVRAYPDATAAVVLAAFVVATAVLFVRATGERRRVALALLMLVVVTCGAIAAGRATISELARPTGYLGSVRESGRYYYQVQALMAVLLCGVLREVTRGRLEHVVRAPLAAIWTIGALSAWVVRSPVPDPHAATRDLVRVARDTIAQEIARQPAGEVACLTLDGRADSFLPVSKSSFPGYAGLFMLLYPRNIVGERHVYFVTADPVALEATKTGGRIASLLVPVGTCPCAADCPQASGASA